MNKTRTLIVVASLSATLLVASVMAQQPNPNVIPRAEGNANFYVPQVRTVPDGVGTTYYTTLVSPANENPVAHKLMIEETSLARSAEALGKQLVEADSDSKRSDVRRKLSDLLGKQFDARQERHKLEIEALEAKVKKLKELVAKRQESRDDIITRRLEQIVRDSQGLGW